MSAHSLALPLFRLRQSMYSLFRPWHSWKWSSGKTPLSGGRTWLRGPPLPSHTNTHARGTHERRRANRHISSHSRQLLVAGWTLRAHSAGWATETAAERIDTIVRSNARVYAPGIRHRAHHHHHAHATSPPVGPASSMDDALFHNALLLLVEDGDEWETWIERASAERGAHGRFPHRNAPTSRLRNRRIVMVAFLQREK